jgi:hypothetical protein
LEKPFMSKIISDAQKQEIRVLLPNSITIGSNTYTISKKWSNEPITAYPAISCNIGNDGYDTGIEDLIDGILYYSCTLTIHIYAGTTSGKDSGAAIAEKIADSIIGIISGWTTPLTDKNVRIFDPRADIGSVGFL